MSYVAAVRLTASNLARLMQQVPQARVAEAHWCVGEGDAQAAKLAKWDPSALRTEEINGFLADPQLNDANCLGI